MVHHSANLETSSSSTPCCRPSTSAAWIKNSAQYGSRKEIDSIQCQRYNNQCKWDTGRTYPGWSPSLWWFANDPSLQTRYRLSCGSSSPKPASTYRHPERRVLTGAAQERICPLGRGTKWWSPTSHIPRLASLDVGYDAAQANKNPCRYKVKNYIDISTKYDPNKKKAICTKSCLLCLRLGRSSIAHFYR